MSDHGKRIAQSAHSLVGTPFRLHGTDPKTGLDCVGLVTSSMRMAGLRPQAPLGYALRNKSIDAFLDFATKSGLENTSGSLFEGDILLVKPSPMQFHLLVVLTHNDFIHANASLRRVVAMPGPLPWPLFKHWRCTSSTL